MLFEGSSQFLKQTVAKKAIYMATTNLHSMAKANLNKSKERLDFYYHSINIPMRPRICNN